MSTLERAIAIAAEAHAGQVDKAGEPYILHPLRVMDHVLVFPGDDVEQLRCVAALHDVAEDCPGWPLERISAAGFRPEIVRSLDAITRRVGERYFDYIERCSGDRVARAVKHADLLDNLGHRSNNTRETLGERANREDRYYRALKIIARSFEADADAEAENAEEPTP